MIGYVKHVLSNEHWQNNFHKFINDHLMINVYFVCTYINICRVAVIQCMRFSLRIMCRHELKWLLYSRKELYDTGRSANNKDNNTLTFLTASSNFIAWPVCLYNWRFDTFNKSIWMTIKLMICVTVFMRSFFYFKMVITYLFEFFWYITKY